VDRNGVRNGVVEGPVGSRGMEGAPAKPLAARQGERDRTARVEGLGALGVADPGPDPELRVTSHRRRFTVGYKLRILDEAERCEPGQVGALLRREGLYSSHLTLWRRQRAAGRLVAGGGRKQSAVERELRRELARKKRENERLRQRLERAETIIVVQKKLSALLQVDLPRVGR
jgi:transposase